MLHNAPGILTEEAEITNEPVDFTRKTRQSILLGEGALVGKLKPFRCTMNQELESAFIALQGSPLGSCSSHNTICTI